MQKKRHVCVSKYLIKYFLSQFYRLIGFIPINVGSNLLLLTWPWRRNRQLNPLKSSPPLSMDDGSTYILGQKGRRDAHHCTYPKFLDSKAFGQSDLEDLEAANVGRQAGQALLATAPHSNQERVTPRSPQDPADATPGERKHTPCRWYPTSPGAMSVSFFTYLDTKFRFSCQTFRPCSSVFPLNKDAARVCPRIACLTNHPG